MGLARPELASACGGTFCDAGAPRAVNQSGENILFVEFEGRLEAHVQIRYQGDPTRFAWLVPLPEEPEVTIGSQALFDTLLESSAPIYGLHKTSVSCDGTVEESDSTGCGGGSETPTSPTATGVASDQMQSGMMADPIGKTVGSFEVTFLHPNSIDEVTQWLTDNAFQLPPGTADRLAPYVEGGSVVAAVRLAPDAGVQEIHPIVFRFRGARALIPIQLTSVAATPDMRVRAFFLGQGRAVPSNYRHVVLDDVRLSWPGFTPSYENAVARAVDETGDGFGFVTEYAGASAVIDPDRVLDPRWSSEVFVGLDPFEAVAELKAQGQLSCVQNTCTLPHPLMLPLLQRYLPAPTGALEGPFYDCPTCMRNQVDLDAWDADAFAADYEARVVEPARRAAERLAASPYLTRLLTFLSPDEMTMDPAFHERTDLPSVGNEHWAQLEERCGEQPRLELPDGRVVVSDGLFLSTQLSRLPMAERIEQIGEAGEPETLQDNAEEIDRAVERWNDSSGSDDGGGADGRSSARTRSSLGCSVSSPAWQQTWLWMLALYTVRRRARPCADACTPGKREG
jgi:hypothetical protein